jgi:alpha-beta hydrolase superfamily lysophospholipase
MTDSWNEPEGIAPRGTLIVAAGRGETSDAYARFGRRIASDGYRVRVLADVTGDVEASFAQAGKLLVDDALPGPKVLAGVDTGALFARALAARQAPGLDAVILAGLPGPTPPDLLDWTAEIEARTACPNHQRVLGDGAAVRGALFSVQVPIELTDVADVTDLAVPSLGLHGEDDVISPLAEVRYPGPLVTIAGGRHDVLNDVTHRTVAATIVLFLERLRLGAGLPEIARVAA